MDRRIGRSARCRPAPRRSQWQRRRDLHDRCQVFLPKPEASTVELDVVQIEPDGALRVLPIYEAKVGKFSTSPWTFFGRGSWRGGPIHLSPNS